MRSLFWCVFLSLAANCAVWLQQGASGLAPSAGGTVLTTALVTSTAICFKAIWFSACAQCKHGGANA